MKWKANGTITIHKFLHIIIFYIYRMANSGIEWYIHFEDALYENTKAEKKMDKLKMFTRQSSENSTLDKRLLLYTKEGS